MIKLRVYSYCWNINRNRCREDVRDINLKRPGMKKREVSPYIYDQYNIIDNTMIRVVTDIDHDYISFNNYTLGSFRYPTTGYIFSMFRSALLFNPNDEFIFPIRTVLVIGGVERDYAYVYRHYAEIEGMLSDICVETNLKEITE